MKKVDIFINIFHIEKKHNFVYWRKRRSWKINEHFTVNKICFWRFQTIKNVCVVSFNVIPYTWLLLFHLFHAVCCVQHTNSIGVGIWCGINRQLLCKLLNSESVSLTNGRDSTSCLTLWQNKLNSSWQFRESESTMTIQIYGFVSSTHSFNTVHDSKVLMNMAGRGMMRLTW